MRKRLCITTAIIIGGISLGYHLVYAYAIQGIDRPFNPPAYYSDTAISYEDSPSPFFYKDLAAGGGTVLDTARKIKSVLFSGDFTNLSGIFTSKTSNDETNTTPLSTTVLEKTSNDVTDINSNTSNLSTSAAIIKERDGTLFRRPDRYDESTNSYDERTQMSWLEKTYLNFAQSAKSSLDDSNSQEEALNAVAENSYGASGDLQAAQTSAQIKAINEAIQARRNALLSNYAALKATNNMAKEDEELKNIRIIDNSVIQVSDPYNQTKQEQQVYTRPSAPGFKDF